METPGGIAPVEWPQGGIVTKEWISQLRSTLDNATRNLKPTELPDILPVSVADQIIIVASKIMHKESNCVEVAAEKDCRVVLVGDVHGQFHDVLHLLDVAGEPSSDRVFVFNGDYVDRGAWGLETYIYLLCWKVLCSQFPSKSLELSFFRSMTLSCDVRQEMDSVRKDLIGF
jgi:serine/threonine-protein phosphatase 5